MNIKSFSKAVLLLLLLGACAACTGFDPHPMDMTSAIRNARTAADQEALAAHYEAAAREADAKVEEHQKDLDSYQSGHLTYGKQVESLVWHCKLFVSNYQSIAKANRYMAGIHHALAQAAR